MLRRIDKIRIFKEIFLILLVAFISISLSNIRIFNNNFVFIVPFVLFCFMNGKVYGYISFLCSFFVLGEINKYFYFSYLLVILYVAGFKFFIKIEKAKFKNIISFSSFFLVLIEGFINLFLCHLNDYFSIFILSVTSYWIMRYFYDLYVNIHVNEEKYITPYLLVFVLSVLGISLLGLYSKIGLFSISLIMIVFIGFSGSRISLETGVLYCFIMIVMFKLLNVYVDVLLFLSTSLVSFLFCKTSKITLLFTYSLIVCSYLHYRDISYLMCLNYCLGALLFTFVPSSVFDYVGEKCYGSDKYVEKIKKDNKHFNAEISNKILQMEEVFSLVTSKIGVKGRIKKSEKELFLEEIDIFDDLLKKYSSEIKERYEFNYNSFIEKEIYKYGYDLLYLNVRMDVFKDVVVDINIRCDKKDVYKVILPVISKIMKKKLSVCKVKENKIFEYYEVRFKVNNIYKLSYGVNQRAKDGEVCGDSYLVYENDYKIIYALSDGMGVGKEAKCRSKLALDVFRKFMDIGFEEEKAINSINCILKSEYNKESYATLDLFIYDKYKKEFSFCKNGACDSYVIRDKEIISVEGDKLPVGIVDKIEVSRTVFDINKGDYVILASDGVSERKINKIKDMKSGDPVKLSNEILKDNKEINDDESIIVIKIK